MPEPGSCSPCSARAQPCPEAAPQPPVRARGHPFLPVTQAHRLRPPPLLALSSPKPGTKSCQSYLPISAFPATSEAPETGFQPTSLAEGPGSLGSMNAHTGIQAPKPPSATCPQDPVPCSACVCYRLVNTKTFEFIVTAPPPSPPEPRLCLEGRRCAWDGSPPGF